MLDCQFLIHACKGPVIMMNQLKFILIVHLKIHIHTTFTPVFR